MSDRLSSPPPREIEWKTKTTTDKILKIRWRSPYSAHRKYFTPRKTIHNHSQRLFRCSGKIVCQNTNCVFFLTMGKRNKNKFKAHPEKQNNNTIICKFCWEKPHITKCYKQKKKTYNQQRVKVSTHYSTEKHTCKPKLKEEINSDIVDLVQEKQLPLQQATIKHIKKKLELIMVQGITQEQFKSDLQVSCNKATFDHIQKLKKEKQLFVSQNINPWLEFEVYSESLACFNFLQLALRPTINSEDNRIYNSNGVVIMFLTEGEFNTLDLCHSLDQDGENKILRDTPIFMDSTYQEVTGWKTWGIHFYHPLLKRLVTLLTAFIQNERVETFKLIFEKLNEKLQDYTGLFFINKIKKIKKNK